MQDVLLIAAGFVVGSMNAIAGGGMLLGFPILLSVGLPALVANVTSNIVVLPGALSSAYGYRRYIRKAPRRHLLLLIPCILGAAVGAIILRETPATKFQHLVPVLVFLAVALFAFQPLIHLRLRQHLQGRSKKLQLLILIATALLPVAVYGGYFGAGFGFVMLAFLGFTNLHDIHQMNGLKNLASASIAAVSIICLFSAHLINWRHGLVMAAGCLIGGHYGSTLAQKVPSHAIRIIVIIIGLGTAAYLAQRTY